MQSSRVKIKHRNYTYILSCNEKVYCTFTVLPEYTLFEATRLNYSIKDIAITFPYILVRLLLALWMLPACTVTFLQYLMEVSVFRQVFVTFF